MDRPVTYKGAERRCIGSIRGDGGPGSGTIWEYRDWRAAAEFSWSRKAVSRDTLMVAVKPYNRAKVMQVKAHLVIELAGGRMSWVFHSSQGIPIDDLEPPHAKDIDKVVWWRPW